LDLRRLQQQFIERVEEASGKPVVLLKDSKFAGHATIKIASKDQPAHLLRYKPEQESVLPYLVAYECESALRTIQADPASQFNLASKPNMLPEVLELMQRHHQGKDDIPSHLVPQLAKQFGNGLGLQLRSMPITMRVDKQLHDAHPELSELQHESIDRQLQENMGALSPRAKVLSPDEIIRPNATMNAAFAKFYLNYGMPRWFLPLMLRRATEKRRQLYLHFMSKFRQVPAMTVNWSTHGLSALVSIAGSKRKLVRCHRNSRLN
jgi:hypothetical protein